MKKNILKKTLVLFLLLSMMISCFPIVAIAADVTYDVNAAVDGAWYTDSQKLDSNGAYVINNAKELAYFMSLSGTETFSGKTVKLGQDIIWNDAEIEGTQFNTKDGNIYKWTSFGNDEAGAFQGTFDGQGYAILGLYNKEGAFIKNAKNATFKNIRFVNCYVQYSSANHAAIIVRRAYGDTTFENVEVSDSYLDVGSKQYGAAFLSAPIRSNGTVSFENCVLKNTNLNSTSTSNKYLGAFVSVGTKNNVTLEFSNCVNFTEYGFVGNPAEGVDITDNKLDVKTESCVIVNNAGVYFANDEVDANAKVAINSLSDFNTADVALEIQGAQVKDNATKGKFDARFVASVNIPQDINDVNQIKQIGFEISVLSDYAQGRNIQSGVCPAVYTSLKSNFGTEDINASDYDNCDYLAVMVVDGIDKNGTQVLLARPYYNTSVNEADRVYGEYVLYTFCNGQIVDARCLGQ